MPNTFLRRGAAVTSKTDVSRPTAIEPVPETVAGDVFAYRGMETHGVEPNAQYQPVPDYSDEEDEVQEYAAEPEYVAPVPVIIVQSGGRELRKYRVTRSLTGALGGNAALIFGGNALRRKATVINTGADLVYIGEQQSTASPMHGFPLAAGATFETDSNDSALWAISSTANAMTLAIKFEYSVIVGD